MQRKQNLKEKKRKEKKSLSQVSESKNKYADFR